MSDLALGIVVFTFAAVPASLLLLALADVIRLEADGARQRWIRNCLWALAIPATLPVGSAVWGWAGAAHLEPLCQAYATAEFRSDRPIKAQGLLIETVGEAAPWTTAISAGLRAPRGPLSFIVAPAQRNAADAPEIVDDAPGTLVLEVRRVLHHENLWFRVEMERFALVDRSVGRTMALADELWITAGRARYHCGVISGRTPTRQTPWPGGDGVAVFIERALRGRPEGQRQTSTTGLKP